MVQGLLETLLDLALPWTPGDVAVRPRKVLAPATSLEETSFPSWPWAGWDGSIKFDQPRNILNHSKPVNVSLRVEVGSFSIATTDRWIGKPFRIVLYIIFVLGPLGNRTISMERTKNPFTSRPLLQRQAFSIRGQQIYHLQGPLPATRILDHQGRHCGLLLDF
jgi:hypothetical protein